MKRNKKLLARTLLHIIENPDEWNQKNWGKKTACGASFCSAGTALVLDGVSYAFNKYDELVILQGSHWTSYGLHIANEAAARLGLERVEAGVLFDPYNTLANVQRIILTLIAGDDITELVFIESLDNKDRLWQNIYYGPSFME